MFDQTQILQNLWITVLSRFILQELLNTGMNNLYVEGFDDYVITEMINMLCSE